jgi:phosphate starvation-inducible PhoH-like protein
MAQAVAFLIAKKVSRIILARPAVEAGEKLGFLPGDLQEKVNPYLRPLYDALYDMLDVERVARYIERGTIEIAPIAFMRGRTPNDSFVILDEAQNTTTEQMKMFLTRLGFGSKMVITGDVTQIDLPSGRTSGLIEATWWSGIAGIAFVVRRATSSATSSSAIVIASMRVFERQQGPGRGDAIGLRPLRSPTRYGVSNGRVADRHGS